MLTKLRAASRSIAFKILVLILVLSSICWTIGTMLNTSDNTDIITFTRAKNITKSEFMQALKLAMSKMPQTSDQNHLNNIQELVLNNLINAHVLEQVANDYNLVLSTLAISKFIQNSKVFNNNDQHFDINIFKSMLKSLNISEDQYLKQAARQQLSEIISHHFIDNNYVPRTLAQNIINLSAETRNIQLVSIDLENEQLQSSLVSPTNEQLQEFYNNNKSKFEKPEQRHIRYIVLDYNYFKNKIVIDNKLLEEFYQTYSDQFQEKSNFANNIAEVKEKYISYQMNKLFTDTMTLLEDEVASGSNLSEIAKMLNVKVLTLSNITKKKLSSNRILGNVTDAIFSLQEHETSYPLDISSRMLVVINIQKIIPSTVEEFDNIRNDVQEEWKKNTIKKLNLELIHKFQQTTNADNFITEAKKYKLTVNPNLTITRLNKNAVDLPKDFVEQLLTLKKDEVSDVYISPQHAYVALVSKVTIDRNLVVKLLLSMDDIRRSFKNLMHQELIAYLFNLYKGEAR
ncbi:surA N-terminal domain protein [Orientia chuto str. Dubai]|uniref:SurA N-terminal domain protein n=1 Tax=Orientia chuto str. Dubai TaxID=1359168 RepID=A0A0F3MSA5_9RICK|nr:SurA N-terminal domain-containing protein [Candidatus Orientia mediorientalis]KJV57494.1 surA N-terminal domain protein [Orientia chuto str. Dubai]